MRRFLSILLLSFWMVSWGAVVTFAVEKTGAAEAPRDFTSSKERLVAALCAHVAQRLSLPESQIDLKLLGPNVWREEISKGASIEVEVKEGSQGAPLGRMVFWVTVTPPGGTPVSQWASAEVAFIQSAVVAQRPLKRFHPIGPTDLAIQTIRLTKVDRYDGVKPEDLIGKRTTRSIAPGVPMTLEMVEESPVIHQGDRVTLVVEIGGLKIMTAGRAKEDGFPGKLVAVVNLDSRKIVYGDVVDASTVKVAFLKE